MKKIKKINLLLVLMIFICSCSKPADTLQTKNIIEGNWTWISSTGGIAPITYNPATSGYTQSLTITATEIKLFKNNSLLSTYQYTIQNQNSIYGGSKPMINYSNNKPKQSFEIIGNKLILMDECYDCLTSEYSKL